MPCFKPKHACAVIPEVLISWTLEIIIPELRDLALTKRHVGSGNEIGRKEESRITCMRMLRINQSKITRPQPSEQTTRVDAYGRAYAFSSATNHIGIAILFGGFRKNVSLELTISYS